MVFGRFSAVSRFAPGFHSEIHCRAIGLALVGVIGTVWRTGIVVFGVRDVAKWCRSRQVVPMPPSGVDTWGPGVAHEAVAGFGPGVCVRGRGSHWR